MNRLRQSFAQLVADGRKTLVPYVTAGYPDCATTVEILSRIDPTQVACVELGIPFSDPIADGPVIQASFSRALDAGFRIDDLLGALSAARDRIRVPLAMMLSYSILYRRGAASFVDAAKQTGFDGMIVPDIAMEEADELAALGAASDLPLVMMVAPTSDHERRLRIAALSDPWVYYQSLVGTTGERAQLPTDLGTHVQQLRGETGKPICVGFGISRPEQVAAVCQVADGAIVGSAIVRRMNAAVERGDSASAIADTVTEFVADLAVAAN